MGRWVLCLSVVKILDVVGWHMRSSIFNFCVPVRMWAGGCCVYQWLKFWVWWGGICAAVN
ncbi:MAG: hypothetical protein APR63_11660 [Desulfuromonas sp. SDB]|nr:MAG: hypothetical protein APR63_11660 [Desulfuromonas sp. SDB]